MNTLRRLLTIAAVALVSLPAAAQERGGKDEAKAMVDAAIAHIKQAGPEQAYKDFGDKANTTWHKKDLYVFVIRMDGVTLAHGANEKLVGKEQVNLKDPNGKAFVQEMMATAKKPEGGWVEYDWSNPVTKKIEGKASFVRPEPSINGFAGVGIYR
ncbi:MAG: cache domain-containing protein [Proteobacteria bacterium]|nr:cache domain-containing protein [Pseudomonadota bacterium]